MWKVCPTSTQIAVRHDNCDKYRAIPIDPRLETVLTAYLTDRWARFGAPGGSHPSPTDNPWVQSPLNTPLWADGHGEPLTVGQLEYFVRKAYSAAGINSHRPPGALIHALRHTFATRLVENGVSAVEVMGLLGHASLHTTQQDIATRPDHLRSAVAANPACGQLRTPRGPDRHSRCRRSCAWCRTVALCSVESGSGR